MVVQLHALKSSNRRRGPKDRASDFRGPVCKSSKSCLQVLKAQVQAEPLMFQAFPCTQIISGGQTQALKSYISCQRMHENQTRNPQPSTKMLNQQGFQQCVHRNPRVREPQFKFLKIVPACDRMFSFEKPPPCKAWG